jgi:hypothetical protein
VSPNPKKAPAEHDKISKVSGTKRNRNEPLVDEEKGRSRRLVIPNRDSDGGPHQFMPSEIEANTPHFNNKKHINIKQNAPMMMQGLSGSQIDITGNSASQDNLAKRGRGRANTD